MCMHSHHKIFNVYIYNGMNASAFIVIGYLIVTRKSGSKL